MRNYARCIVVLFRGLSVEWQNLPAKKEKKKKKKTITVKKTEFSFWPTL